MRTTTETLSCDRCTNDIDEQGGAEVYFRINVQRLGPDLEIDINDPGPQMAWDLCFTCGMAVGQFTSTPPAD